MGFAKLNDLEFRLNPNALSWDYSIDYAVIPTLAGQVVQVLGSTVGDMVIKGSFGQTKDKRSWEMAEEFNDKIRHMMDQQTSLRSTKTSLLDMQQVAYPFSYNDGYHNNWNFRVLIKSLKDGDGRGSMAHRPGKIAYEYTLTLFIVQDESEILNQLSTDAYINNFSGGVGWKQTRFNGSLSTQDAIDFITEKSPTDPTLNGYLSTLLGDS